MFLLTYTEQHGLLLPGRVPGYSRSDIRLLPSSTSRRGIWKLYSAATEGDERYHVVAYSTFCKLWRVQLPQIRLMKPMTDLCATCQQNSTTLLRAANTSEATKTAKYQSAIEHLRLVGCERSFYKTKCDECREEVIQLFTEDGVFQPPPFVPQCTPTTTTTVLPNSRDIRVHYSFDYAQQVHYPSDPMQPGPIYFLTPRKCSVFGVNCEAIPRQVNFLGDEAGECGKGANTVVSNLDFFFEHHGLGETEVFLHADNCTGQNKNNCMLHYLMWRVMTGRHTQITLSFLVVGHTKFSPDWCFGLFKRLYRRTKVGSLQAIAQVANDSAYCNEHQLVSTADGTTVVTRYDWTSFFVTRFKKLSKLKSYHHFRVCSSEPGVVYTRIHSDTPEVRHQLLKEDSLEWRPSYDEYPPVVDPKGLSAQRQWYLYEKIRPFCPEEDQDITCPEPTVPRPGSRAGTPADDADIDTGGDVASDAASDEEEAPPPAKKSRRCGICRGMGHNKRSCPDRKQ